MKKLSCNLSSVIILGAGGHATVALSLARACGYTIIGVCDPHLSKEGVSTWQGIAVLGGDEILDTVDPTITGLVNGLGFLPKTVARKKIYTIFRNKGFEFPVLIHPFSWVAENVVLLDGAQVMAGCVIQPGSVIRENTIVNTRVSIDHDCRIGSNAHIAPGAVLCGNVSVDNEVFVGAGAVLVQGISIGESAIVGAGATCLNNLDCNELYIGSVAKRT